MTGGPGKIKIEANVYLVLQARKIKVDDAAVYIHVRGYMRARVTHVDIEDRILGKIIHRGRGNMLKIAGVRGGIEISPKEPREMDINGSKTVVYGLEVRHPLLNEVLDVGSSTVTWVGRKYDGIYIGFKEAQMKKLEQMAEKIYGVIPRKTLDQKEKLIQNF
jgi:hypothetical protein